MSHRARWLLGPGTNLAIATCGGDFFFARGEVLIDLPAAFHPYRVEPSRAAISDELRLARQRITDIVNVLDRTRRCLKGGRATSKRKLSGTAEVQAYKVYIGLRWSRVRDFLVIVSSCLRLTIDRGPSGSTRYA